MRQFVTFLGLILLCSSLSHAAVTITFSESGDDVVATSSGSLITTGLINPSELGGTLGYVAGAGFSAGWSCVLLVGTDPIEADTFSFPNWTNNNVDVCASGGRRVASSGSGNFVGLFSINGGSHGIYVPNNYVSGSPIAGTSTWSSATFASLGLVQGTYLFTFGDGATADSITLNIGVAEPPSTYTVGGAVSGLTGTGLTLQNNGGDTLAVAANGVFTFATALTDLSDYLVEVLTQPTGQTCIVNNGSGMIDGAGITDVGITCEDDVGPPGEQPERAVPIPTLENWALMTLFALLGIMVIVNRRRLF